MENIKICIINQFGYPLYNNNCKKKLIGGAEVQLYLLTKEFTKDPRFDVYVLTGKYMDKKKKLEVLNNVRIYQVLPTNFLPIKRTLKNIFKIINFFIFLKKFDPDIIIQRSAGFATFLCALYSKIFRKKFVYSISSEPDVNGEAKGLYWGKAKGLYGKFYKFGLSQASYIVAQSTNQIRNLEKWQNRMIFNIYVIKSGYSITPIDLKLKNTILWVGRAVKIKRPEIFIKLAKHFPNQTFIMICNKVTDIEYWKQIKQKAETIPNLKFVPFVLFENIDQYFKNSKVFINTSSYEGFPNTFIQAAKNKTPLLSLYSNPDNFLIDYRCGFVCDNNFEKMVNNLELLLKNKDLHDKFSENALKYVKEHHDIKKNSKKWINLLIQVYKSP